LPIITIDYIHPSPFQSEGAVPIDQKPINREKEVYRLEAFVSTEKHITENAVVFVQFSIVSGKEGKIAVQNESPDKVQIQNSKKNLPSDKIHIYADSNWTFSRGMIHSILKPGLKATIAIPTKTIFENSFKFNDQSFQVHKEETIKVWKSIISKATQVEVSEARINNAWKNLIVQNFMLINNDKIFYSSGNQYEQLYSSEGSEAVLSLINWNFEEKAKALVVPILDFSRKGLEYYQAGIKILDVIKIWQQTKDIDFIKEMRPRWEKELFKILNNLGDENGSLPKEKYCGDISTPVHSLAVDAKAWRSLKDIQPLLKELKAVELLILVQKEEKRYKENIIKALEVSILKGTNPPFIPIVLFGKEETHSPIPSTRIGSYWNLIIGFVIARKIFPLGSIEESFIPDYQEKNGGIFMGMIRSGGTSHAFWTGSERINPLYGSRYSYDFLRRDLPEKYLVGFYGMLSQGFTRNTFIGGEGSTLEQVDDGGRFFYCSLIVLLTHISYLCLKI